MGVTSFIMGVAAFTLALVSLLPMLWWLNAIVIPLAVIGFLFGAGGLGVGVMKANAATGLLLNVGAFAIGVWRL